MRRWMWRIFVAGALTLMLGTVALWGGGQWGMGYLRRTSLSRSGIIETRSGVQLMRWKDAIELSVWTTVIRPDGSPESAVIMNVWKFSPGIHRSVGYPRRLQDKNGDDSRWGFEWRSESET